MSKPLVGFVGLGAMGLPMARNLLKAGFPLKVWARRREGAKDVVADGAEWAESPSTLGSSCDVVILIVTNSPDVEELVTGPHGLLSEAHEGLVIVDMSTIAPAVTRSLAERCKKHGVTFLDAPVSGGTPRAHEGTLTVMVGGDREGFERARPVLEAMGEKIFHVGPSGAGEVIKLVNNMLAGIIAAATAEALVMGVKAGADVQTMSEIVGVSTGGNWQLANQFPLRAFNGSFKPGFMTDLLVKDLGLVLELAAEQQSPVFLTSIARQLFIEAQAAGHGRADYTSVLRVLEQVAGVEVRAEKT
jgi:3-hydroxyisobutyrate dehydrogenase